jgi:dienelactone hydrolase
MGSCLALSGRAGSPDKQRAELEQLKRLLPPSAAFDRWLDKYGYLPPDFDALPALPDPPDLLTIMRDGKARPVTAQEWPERRQEIQALSEEWLMGHAPPAPGNTRAVIEEKRKETGKEVWTVRLEFGPDHAARLHCWLWIPDNLQKPAPVFLVDHDNYTRFALEEFKAGRFMICIYNATDPVYTPDHKDESAAYNDLFGKYDWCEFHRRGWSASRAVDWLSTLDFVARDKLFIGGHSRSAKQALAAAAFDERFAGVIASSPGSGGSLPFRFCDQFNYGESAERLTTVFPDWVSPKIRFFAGRENELPADMHFIYALIAPRAVFMSTAINDAVENTWAVEQMRGLIQPVWDLLGKPGNLALRYHIGPHAPDAATVSAANLFLRLASEGRSVAEAFPFRPLHPWDYQAWARTNPPLVNPASLPERSISDPTLDRNGQLLSAAQWPLARRRILERIYWLLGDGPAYEPASAEIGAGESEAEAKLLDRLNPPPPQRTKCRFGNGLNGNFYHPSAAKPAGKLPTVIWLCPFHTSIGYTPIYRVGDMPHLRLAKAGFLVFAFDPIGTGERQEEGRTFYDRHPGWSLMGQMVLDARHAIDAAAANPDADPKQIYLVGFAMGGMVAALTAALDERAAGEVSVAGFTPWRTDTAASGTGGVRRYSHLYGWLPRLGVFAGQESKVPVDFNEILAAAAPRRMLVVSPAFDWHETHQDVLRAVDMARRVYRLLGAGDRLQLQSPERILQFDNDMQTQVIEWIKNP